MTAATQKNLKQEIVTAKTAEIVAILNCTPDSFSSDGLNASLDKQISAINSLVENGITHIDIGAESTRPGATPITSDEEWDRLEPILDWIKQNHPTLSISIDSYHVATISKALDYNIAFINDVSGLKHDQMISLAAESSLKVILMHNLGVPATRELTLDESQPAIEHIRQWFDDKLKKLDKTSLDLNQIILDPGIGFGKTPEQNISILQNIAQLKEFQLPIYVGHSRKSFLSAFSNAEPKDRDIETYSVSQWIVSQGVDYLRVHDAIGHKRLLNTWQQIAQ